MNPSVVKLRGTAFMPVSIGYNEENENKFRVLLPGGRVQPIMPMPQETIIRSGMRLGEPWQMEKNGRSISFNYTRVDIVENRANDQIATEAEFVNFCIDTFSKLLKDVGYYTRIAYSPTFAMDEKDEFNCKDWWRTIFVDVTKAGLPMKEINLTYLLTKTIKLGNVDFAFNIHHTIFDGYKCDSNQVKVNDSIIITLDLNTAEGDNVIIKDNVITPFFKEAMNEKDVIMKKYFCI